VTGQGICGETAERIDCDLLCTSVGYMPAYQLACQGGASLAYDDDTAAFTLTGLPPGMHLAGSIDGAWDLEAVRQLAERAALSACQGLSGDNPDRDSGRPPRQAAGDSGRSEGAGASLPGANHPWPIFPHPRGKEFVDLDEDLQIADLVNATNDGFEDIQLVKRYSTCGMGPSQGRQSALAAARIVARATGKSVAQTGVTTARPPYAGERIAHNARRNFFPVRHTSMHHRHAEAGAQMLQAGLWLRPAWYGPPDSGDACIAAEVDAVRNAVGVVDVSTLGGIEVRGPDAGEFLDRLYTWNFASQPVGRARYALLCNEAGMVIDDGVACRLHERHYYVTATTGGVDRVYRSMLRWNAQWRLDVDIANATSAWCGVNIAGPRAREVLAGLTDGIDLDRSAFPYMGVREGTVAGIDARVIRVGFVGELGYEVHVPQQCGEALWDAVMEAGEPSGIRPFGIEAQRVLRLEKGHVIIGQDTDAMTHPQEIGMGWALSDKKPFYVGQRTIRELGARPLSRQLAGFTMASPSSDMPAESHLVVDGQRLVGRVTSCAMSPTLGRVVGLAYVPPESARPGEVIDIRLTGGRIVQANIVPMPFYDPDNERQKL
jgi:sarcosine oxidase subunit alpha